MHLTVLAVPDCPNAPVLTGRLTAVLADLDGVSLSHQVISDEVAAASWGMHGSPTLLIDGVDPFAAPGQPASMSCRLFADENGQLSGAPSVGQLRQAIEAVSRRGRRLGGSGVVGFARTCREGPDRTGGAWLAGRASGRSALFRAHRGRA